MVESYLVRPNISKWEQTRIIMSSDFEALDVNHYIYVPRGFLLGNLKERKKGFVFDGVSYTDSPEELRSYQLDIDGGKLKIVTELDLKDEVISLLQREGSACVEAKKKLEALVRSTEFKLGLIPNIHERKLEYRKDN